MNESHGYAIPLATRPRMSTTILNILATGKLNYADYWTKHHPAPHCQNMRKEFLTPHITTFDTHGQSVISYYECCYAKLRMVLGSEVCHRYLSGLA